MIFTAGWLAVWFVCGAPTFLHGAHGAWLIAAVVCIVIDVGNMVPSTATGRAANAARSHCDHGAGRDHAAE